MAGRNSLLVRAQRKPKSYQGPGYNRILPRYPNKLKSWLSKNRPEYIYENRQINKELRGKLLSVGIPANLYRRIQDNLTIVSLDELHDLAGILGCSVADLI